MKKQGQTPNPHDGVYTRIRPSKIHGVGVFAIRVIPKGASVFPHDESELVWLKKADIGLKKLPKEIQRLYQDFCIIKKNGEKFGCPKNFNLMTISWLLNSSKKPNVGCDEEFKFFALRSIKPGEELTVDYDSYNQFFEKGSPTGK